VHPQTRIARASHQPIVRHPIIADRLPTERSARATPCGRTVEKGRAPEYLNPGAHGLGQVFFPNDQITYCVTTVLRATKRGKTSELAPCRLLKCFRVQQSAYTTAQMKHAPFPPVCVFSVSALMRQPRFAQQHTPLPSNRSSSNRKPEGADDSGAEVHSTRDRLLVRFAHRSLVRPVRLRRVAVCGGRLRHLRARLRSHRRVETPLGLRVALLEVHAQVRPASSIPVH